MRLSYPLLVALLSLGSAEALAQACVITSNDQELPIKMCQQNISIPDGLFSSSFCQPQIPDRSFDIEFVESCPVGAYGKCVGAKAEGVAYEQTIHYYSDPADAPVLKGYCEKISNGSWQVP